MTMQQEFNFTCEHPPAISAMEARQEVSHLVLRAATGDLTYDEAKDLAGPYLAVMDAKGSEIAKKHGKRYTPRSFGYFLRLGPA